jgi:hypothetical protein
MSRKEAYVGRHEREREREREREAHVLFFMVLEGSGFYAPVFRSVVRLLTTHRQLCIPQTG